MGMPGIESWGLPRTYLCFVNAPCRGCVVNTQLLLVSRAAIASIIAGRNDEMRRGCSVVLAMTWQAGLRGTTRTQYESVAAIRDLRGGREGARRDIWPG